MVDNNNNKGFQNNQNKLDFLLDNWYKKTPHLFEHTDRAKRVLAFLPAQSNNKASTFRNIQLRLYAWIKLHHFNFSFIYVNIYIFPLRWIIYQDSHRALQCSASFGALTMHVPLFGGHVPWKVPGGFRFRKDF